MIADDPLRLARPDLVDLPAYATDERSDDLLRLDANEVSWRPRGSARSLALNRYPPLRSAALAARLAELYAVEPGGALATRGSDEAIDLVVRAFCRAGDDAVLVLPPTFALYALAARIQGAHVVAVARARDRGFAIDLDAVAARLDGVKLVFVADPDNPTGRPVAQGELDALVELTAGRALLVVDEAYGEFSGRPSAVGRLAVAPHVIVLRTLSKAHALAGARCGAVVARPEIVALLARILPPFPLPRPTIAAALAQLAPRALARTRRRVAYLVRRRERLAAALRALSIVRAVFSSAANFLLVAFVDVARAKAALAAAGIATRAFPEPEIADCLRVTIGDARESDRLLSALERA